ncbi:MAG: 50S ribosomal protein L6 [Candidatus Omnitrophica bacterium]|nr:50S ribosomal protein L6 [Candidatus Omnitrophota bacterium]
MSRVGRKPIAVPKGVKVEIKDNEVTVQGTKGKLSLKIPNSYKVTLDKENITVTRPSDLKINMSQHGLYRSLINNLIIGVTEGYNKKLEIQGVGYKAQVQGKNLNMLLGFSHQINFPIPEGITIKAPKPTQVHIEGIDKKLVGEVAATIRAFYKPEPYKGKGIRYEGEYVRRKAGKTVV